MGAPTVKLTPVARLDLIEEIVELSATAIRLRHPDAPLLAQVTTNNLRDVADADLVAERDRLAAWIAERSGSGGSNAPEVAAG